MQAIWVRTWKEKVKSETRNSPLKKTKTKKKKLSKTNKQTNKKKQLWYNQMTKLVDQTIFLQRVSKVKLATLVEGDSKAPFSNSYYNEV